MDGLAARFGDRVDFIKLDIDKDETLPVRQQFSLIQRSQYALVDANGNVIQRWFGFLDEVEVERAIKEFLSQQG